MNFIKNYFSSFFIFFLIGISPPLILILLEWVLFNQNRLLDLFIIYALLIGTISGLFGVAFYYNKKLGKKVSLLLIIYIFLYLFMIIFLLMIFLFYVSPITPFIDI